MVSDACSTGKPVYIINIPSKSKKFGLFIKNLINLKLIKFFNGTISLKNNKNALNDIETIVEEIKKKKFFIF
jgi:mitochondrial fission protein ELM1